MFKLSTMKADKLILGGCVIIIFVVFPVLMLVSKHQDSAARKVSLASAAGVAIDNPLPPLPENAGPPPLAPGTKAIDFESETLDGKNYKFNSQSSHIKIVDFWATWCGPCHMAIPGLIELNNTFRSSGVEMVGVSVDTDTVNQVLPYTKAMNMDYTVVADPQKNALAQSEYNANSLPSLYIIDGKGTVRWSFSGYWPDEEAYIRQVIADIQSGQPIDQS